MANPPPIVCAYLKLPPEQHTFFRMREIPLVFLEKLDRLSLVLAVQPSPVALQIMRDLREMAGEQCKKLSDVMFSGHKFATIYLEFLHALSPDLVGEETFLNVLLVNNHASIAADDMEAALKAMIKFRQYLTDAAGRIATLLSDNKKSTDDTVFTAENSQDVREFVNAVDECNALLRQSGEYYREIEKQTEDEESIRSNQPSDEEIKIMQDRWTAFSMSIKGLKDGFGPLHRRILKGGDIHRADASYDNSRTSGDAERAGSSNPTDAPNGRKAILDANVSNPSPKTSRWRSFLQRIFSCLTLKHLS